jgi:VWFA-related protein
MKHLSAILPLALLMAVSVVAQQGTPAPAGDEAQERPRFRGGANLVRLDAYVTIDGASVSDLTAQDFEVFEDNVAQRVESLELIRPRGLAPQSERREPQTVAESRAMAVDANARLFVLFLDIYHVPLAGSFQARKPLVQFLDRAIGRDDMVGVMTPQMSARNVTLARRTETIEGILTDNWYWGQRDSTVTKDEREQAIENCYPNVGSTAGIAEQVISRMRERHTLDAIDDLIVHLDGLREERKFVVMLSSGWLMPRRDDSLARRTSPGDVPQGPRIGVGPEGKLTTGSDPRRMTDSDICERERMRASADDLESDFIRLFQRANRANVSFYTVDPRGLVVFDTDLSQKPLSAEEDNRRLMSRQTSLRTLAEITDGFAIVNTNNMTPGLERIVADTNSYYLLGYYSTNTRLDGKFRKITVKVKRPKADVRARPGYLAPTEADLASSRVDALMNGAPPGHSSARKEFARTLEKLTPTRGNLPVRIQVAAAPSRIWMTAELDPTTLKLPEWQKGGRARVVMEHESGAAPPIEQHITLDAGQRAFEVTPPPGTSVAPGRYVVRLQLTPAEGSVPIQATADVVVPDADALMSQSGLVLRRGPSTGLQFVPTADPRFRRTERLRVEVPRLATDGTVSARLLGRDGQPLALAVTLSERTDDALGIRLIVAEVPLAALAQGDYGLEVTLDANGKKQGTTYGFRLVP